MGLSRNLYSYYIKYIKFEFHLLSPDTVKDEHKQRFLDLTSAYQQI